MVPEHAFEAATFDAWNDLKAKKSFNVQVLFFPPLSEAGKCHFECFLLMFVYFT